MLAFDVEVPQDGTYDLSVFANSYNLYDLVKEQGPTNVFLRVDGADPQELRLPLGYKWVVWGHTDTTVKLSAGKHRITLAAKDPDLGVTKGDAIIDKVDLSLRDGHVAAPAVYEAEYATLSGALPRYDRPGASGPGAVPLAKGDSATFWVHSAAGGESTLSVDHLGGGRASLSLNGEKLDVPEVGGPKKGTDQVRVFLSGGINKITLTGAVHELVLDRLRVAPSSGPLTTKVYQAEDGRLTGAAKVSDAYTFASGGRAVTDIGDGKANALSVDVVAEKAGRHAVTIRYSNAEQAPATHYNPDPIARHADLSVNGGPARRVLFPTTFHFNNFWELTVPLTLKKGANRLTFTAEELPDFNGDTYNQYDQRSPYAPVIDRIAVTPSHRSSPDASPPWRAAHAPPFTSSGDQNRRPADGPGGESAPRHRLARRRHLRHRGLRHRRRSPHLPRLGNDLRDDPGRGAAAGPLLQGRQVALHAGGGAGSTTAATAPASPATRPAGTPPWPSTSGPPLWAARSSCSRTTCGAPTPPPPRAGPATTVTGHFSTTSSPSSSTTSAPTT